MGGGDGDCEPTFAFFRPSQIHFPGHFPNLFALVWHSSHLSICAGSWDFLEVQWGGDWPVVLKRVHVDGDMGQHVVL